MFVCLCTCAHPVCESSAQPYFGLVLFIYKGLILAVALVFTFRYATWSICIQKGFVNVLFWEYMKMWKFTFFPTLQNAQFAGSAQWVWWSGLYAYCLFSDGDSLSVRLHSDRLRIVPRRRWGFSDRFTCTGMRSVLGSWTLVKREVDIYWYTVIVKYLYIF